MDCLVFSLLSENLSKALKIEGMQKCQALCTFFVCLFFWGGGGRGVSSEQDLFDWFDLEWFVISFAVCFCHLFFVCFLQFVFIVQSGYVLCVLFFSF